MIRLIKDYSAAVINGFLVISDLHIGFEKELQEKGYIVPSQTAKMLESILFIKKKVSRLLILGDLKHEISLLYRKELSDFLAKLSDNFREIIIIKGNHDGLVEKYAKNFGNIEVKDELLIRNYLFIHGHKMPSKEALGKANALILGHFHSSFEFKNYLGKITKLKTWNFYTFDNSKFFAEKKIKTGIQLMVSFPAFNEFFTGSGEKNGPLKNYISLKESITLNHIKIL